MKTSRVITLVLVAVTTLLCCFPVAALDVANSYSYSNVIDNSLTQYLNVSVMYADDESYAYGTDSDVVQYYDAPTYQALVNYRVKNTSDQDADLGVSYISLDFGLQASGYNVIGVEYVSGALEPYYVSISDFRLQQVDGTSTSVIVPAGGYISGTFIIHLQETYDNSSGTHIEYPAFSNFNTWDTFSPVYGNYNSSVIDYVSDIYVEALDMGVTLDSIYNTLNSDQTFSDLSLPNAQFFSSAAGTTVNGVQVNRYASSMGYQLVSASTVWDPNVSNYVERYIVKLPITLMVSYYNANDFSVYYDGVLTLPFHSGSAYSSSFFVGASVSSTGSNVTLSDITGTIYTRNFHFISSNGTTIIPAGESLRFYLVYDLYYSFTSLDTFTFVPSFYAGPLNPNWVTYTTSVEDIVDEQHEQEQTYYDDTNTALENSGLPDYNFNSQQTGGLSGVSDDFVRVWNACGALNSVFVFSLTLSLALYILRHRRRL